MYRNYMEYAGSDVRGFAEFGYDGEGQPAARLSRRFTSEHGISQQGEVFLVNHAAKTPTLVTIGTLGRDFVSCILKNVFTALGNLCRGSNKVKVQLGTVGWFMFDGQTRHYRIRVNRISQIHAAYRAGDERLCALANQAGTYQQQDLGKTGLTVTSRSGVAPEPAVAPSFDLRGATTYRGKQE